MCYPGNGGADCENPGGRNRIIFSPHLSMSRQRIGGEMKTEESKKRNNTVQTLIRTLKAKQTKQETKTVPHVGGSFGGNDMVEQELMILNSDPVWHRWFGIEDD
jgi:hypothetical protein